MCCSNSRENLAEAGHHWVKTPSSTLVQVSVNAFGNNLSHAGSMKIIPAFHVYPSTDNIFFFHHPSLTLATFCSILQLRPLSPYPNRGYCNEQHNQSEYFFSLFGRPKSTADIGLRRCPYIYISTNLCELVQLSPGLLSKIL